MARDRIANVLLARKGRDNLGGAARAAEDIARQAAREMLAPLLDAACGRLAFVLRRSVDAAAERASRSGTGRDLLQPYTVRWRATPACLWLPTAPGPQVTALATARITTQLLPC